MTEDGRVIDPVTGEEEVDQDVNAHEGGAIEEAEIVRRQAKGAGEKKGKKKKEEKQEKKEKEQKVTQFSAAEKRYQQKLEERRAYQKEKKKQRNQLMRVSFSPLFSFFFPLLFSISLFSFVLLDLLSWNLY